MDFKHENNNSINIDNNMDNNIQQNKEDKKKFRLFLINSLNQFNNYKNVIKYLFHKIYK